MRAKLRRLVSTPLTLFFFLSFFLAAGGHCFIGDSIWPLLPFSIIWLIRFYPTNNHQISSKSNHSHGMWFPNPPLSVQKIFSLVNQLSWSSTIRRLLLVGAWGSNSIWVDSCDKSLNNTLSCKFHLISRQKLGYCLQLEVMDSYMASVSDVSANWMRTCGPLEA